jgi:hypothetical protein
MTQEHSSRSHPAGAPFGMFLLARWCERRHQGLDAPVGFANPRGASHSVARPAGRLPTALGQQAARPVAGACRGGGGMIWLARRHLLRLHLLRQPDVWTDRHVTGRSFGLAGCPSRWPRPCPSPHVTSSVPSISIHQGEPVTSGDSDHPGACPRRSQGSQAQVRLPCLRPKNRSSCGAVPVVVPSVAG